MLGHKTTDKIKYEIADLTIWISPLSGQQKDELADLVAQSKNNLTMANKLTRTAMQFCVKKVDGAQFYNEYDEIEDFKVELENGILTQDSCDFLLNLPVNNDIMTLCSSLLGGVPTEFVDAEGKPMKGIKYIPREVKKKKKTKKK